MNSLLNQIPALLLLQSALIFLFAYDRGFPLWLSVLIPEMILVGEILLGESRWERRKLCFAVLLTGLAFVLPFVFLRRMTDEKTLPREVSGNFIVAERRSWGDGELLRLKDRDGNGWIVRAKEKLDKAREGERYALEARVVPFPRDEERNGSFSPRRYWHSRGVLGELRNLKKVGRLKDSFSFYALRQRLRDRIARLPENSRALVAAVLLGDRDANLREDFRRWGMSHFLAVSGWHVGLALMLGCFLFGSKRRGLPLCSLLLWGYCFLSGASMSALRAALMTQIGIIGLYTGGRARALNSVGAAGLVMLLWNPWTAFDVGWQLSVLSAAAVTALVRCARTLGVILAAPLLWFLTSPLAAPLARGIYFSSLPLNAMASILFAFLLGFVLLGSLPTLSALNRYYFSLP